MFANTANFGQMMSMMQGSINNNIDPNDPKNNNYNQLATDLLVYALAYTYSIGENLSDSTMLAGAGKLVDDTRQIIRGAKAGGTTGGLRGLKEVDQKWQQVMFQQYLDKLVIFNDEHQKIATSMKEYFKRNIAEGDLEYDYDQRGRKYDKFLYFNQYEKDDLDRELEAVFPNLTPVRNYIPFKYDVFGNQVSVPLKSNEKRFLRKNAGLIFDDNLKKLVKQDFYKNETRKFIKQG